MKLRATLTLTLLFSSASISAFAQATADEELSADCRSFKQPVIGGRFRCPASTDTVAPTFPRSTTSRAATRSGTSRTTISATRGDGPRCGD